MGSLRVISADNHPFVVPGIRSALSKQRDILIAEEAPSSSALICLLQTAPCDVLAIAITMPASGNAVTRAVSSEWAFRSSPMFAKFKMFDRRRRTA
jgi:DNA-binding NarL/FixJ family response regulator